jgi:hypothetical protein
LNFTFVAEIIEIIESPKLKGQSSQVGITVIYCNVEVQEIYFGPFAANLPFLNVSCIWWKENEVQSGMFPSLHHQIAPPQLTLLLCIILRHFLVPYIL